ncbi:MAG TPA: aldehyde dehydrogenase family protein, partial [Candidatus Kapabacteria bacterium]|nr:aldehyde dehydrogenase family protein [Candidatus Kapabacteria bacterium]
MEFQQLIEKHAATLTEAIEANATRTFYAHWPEPPSGKIYGETANDDGLAQFRNRLNKPFDGLLQQGSDGTVGEEQSPYGFPLGITYPTWSADTLAANANQAQKQWSRLSPADRAAVCIELLERAAAHFFEIGYATMHTTGQGFVMAFQASGPHAFDRALEAVAMGYAATTYFDYSQTWTKPMGKISVTLEKRFHAVPKGPNCTIGCSTFPIWNSFPGMFASLITGNVTIAKAHPQVIYPIALCVASFQQTLQDLGLDPHIIQLATDTITQPITFDIAKHPAIKLLDFTGSPSVGAEIEAIARTDGKPVFTEKAGVNTVIIDSVENLDAVLDNIAFSIALYSGQMCTAPQNIFIAKEGVRQGEEIIPYEQVVQRFVEKIDAMANNEKMGPGTFGAIQSEATVRRLQRAAELECTILRNAEPCKQPGFDNARSYSPFIAEVPMVRPDIYESEWFGPITFIIPVQSFEQALEQVYKSVKINGALTTAVYTTDEGRMAAAEESIIMAGAPVAF